MNTENLPDKEEQKIPSGGGKGSALFPFIIGLLAGIIIVLAVFLVKTRLVKNDSPSSTYAFSKVKSIERIIDDKYMGEIDKALLSDYMMLGLVTGLEDPYSTYYTEEEFRLVTEVQSGSFKGIGATLFINDDGKPEVRSLIPGSPAEEAGMKEGDIIYSVDGTPTEGETLQTVVGFIRYSEDDVVTVVCLRGEEKMSYDITKAFIDDVSASGEMLEDGIGYITITAFNQNTPDQFEKALEELKAQNMEGLVIDLRNNPGGLLSSVCSICRDILPEGLICYAEDKKGNRDDYTCTGENELDLPLAVLINKESASASEIMAGAVQDHEKGVLVGETSFGKGIIQNTYRLSDGSVLKLTIAHYYTPGGRDIHMVGVTPDIVEEDPELQLEKAIEAVKKM